MKLDDQRGPIFNFAPPVVLQPPSLDDVPKLVAGLNDLEVSRWTARIPHPYTADDARAFVASCRSSWLEGEALWLGIYLYDDVFFDAVFSFFETEFDGEGEAPWSLKELIGPRYETWAALSPGLIGAIGLSQLSTEAPSLGYWLAKPYHGQGLMGRALGTFMGLVMDSYAPTRLSACVMEGNEASMHLLYQHGFDQVGQDIGFCRATGQNGPRRLYEWRADAETAVSSPRDE